MRNKRSSQAKKPTAPPTDVVAFLKGNMTMLDQTKLSNNIAEQWDNYNPAQDIWTFIAAVYGAMGVACPPKRPLIVAPPRLSESPRHFSLTIEIGGYNGIGSAACACI